MILFLNAVLTFIVALLFGRFIFGLIPIVLLFTVFPFAISMDREKARKLRGDK